MSEGEMSGVEIARHIDVLERKREWAEAKAAEPWARERVKRERWEAEIAAYHAAITTLRFRRMLGGDPEKLLEDVAEALGDSTSPELRALGRRAKMMVEDLSVSG